MLIPAKGLTGPGYDGHAFWDTEAFVLPLLTYMRPRAASDALRWRHQTLDLARERARSLGLRGAAFPWRTIAGQECSGYWPAGTAAFHVDAAIANAVNRYQLITEDEAFEREAGVELLVGGRQAASDPPERTCRNPPESWRVESPHAPGQGRWSWRRDLVWGTPGPAQSP